MGRGRGPASRIDDARPGLAAEGPRRRGLSARPVLGGLELRRSGAPDRCAESGDRVGRFLLASGNRHADKLAQFRRLTLSIRCRSAQMHEGLRWLELPTNCRTKVMRSKLMAG